MAQRGWDGWLPWCAGEPAAQDGEDVLAVSAGGVDVAADVEPVSVASSLVTRPEIFCWVLTGRTPRSLR